MKIHTYLHVKSTLSNPVRFKSIDNFFKKDNKEGKGDKNRWKKGGKDIGKDLLILEKNSFSLIQNEKLNS